MAFPVDVVEKALVSCGRHCCLCHKFCSTKIELHHIKQKADGGEDTYDNCIPLCLDCHAEVKAYNPRHPKGRQYTENELKQHRDNWFQKVAASGGMTNNEGNLDMDREVFFRITQMLPSDRMRTITNNNFAGFSYNRRIVTDPLFDFLNLCEDPAFEFLDADLEALRGLLQSFIDKFVGILCINSFPIKGDLSSIPEEWEIEQPDRFLQVVNSVHDISGEIWATYSDLIKLGRRKLLISPSANAGYVHTV